MKIKKAIQLSVENSWPCTSYRGKLGTVNWTQGVIQTLTFNIWRTPYHKPLDLARATVLLDAVVRNLAINLEWNGVDWSPIRDQHGLGIRAWPKGQRYREIIARCAGDYKKSKLVFTFKE